MFGVYENGDFLQIGSYRLFFGGGYAKEVIEVRHTANRM